MWERALRRSRLPVACSQGFVPHPLVSFGLALPTGASRSGEYLDVRLGPAEAGEIPVAELPAALSVLLPEGIDVPAAALVEEAEGSLQQEVASCDWELEVLGVPGEELQEQVESCSLPRSSRSGGSGRVVKPRTTSARPSWLFP